MTKVNRLMSVKSRFSYLCDGMMRKHDSNTEGRENGTLIRHSELRVVCNDTQKVAKPKENCSINNLECQFYVTSVFPTKFPHQISISKHS